MAEEQKIPEEYEETEKLKVGNKERDVRVLKVPIEWDGRTEWVWIKKLAFGERSSFTEKFMTVDPKTENVRLSMSNMHLHAILQTVIKAPFPINMDYLMHELDPSIGYKLYNKATEYNQLKEEQKKTNVVQ